MLKPFIKWPGSKNTEIKEIIKYLPNNINNYYEPFLGGGSVYFSINNCDKFFVNDRCNELIKLYQYIKNQNKKFIKKLEILNNFWKYIDIKIKDNKKYLIDLYEKELNVESKFCDIFDNLKEFEDVIYYPNILKYKMNLNIYKKLSKQKNNIDILNSIKTAFKFSFYNYVREIYNDNKYDDELNILFFYFIREYCYSSMFRYSKNGNFNVPYGGLSYNNKNFDNKIEYIKSEELLQRLNKTEFFDDDFELFFDRFKLTENDFIFFDPPYDTDFSTYSNNVFNKNDQIRLNNFCNNIKAKFMFVIKNTEFIYNLYKNFNIISFNKKYNVNFKNRNDRNVEHLVITNY